MARLALNKASLTRESRQLRTFREYLPSLDLKRRQLIAEQNTARRILRETRQQLEDLEPVIAGELPMLASTQVELAGLVTLHGVELGTENVVGSRLPTVQRIDIRVRDYALLGKPHWVDRVAKSLVAALEIRIRLQVAARRLEVLEGAVRRITQRVNLFEKVLIPRTVANIKKINVYLSDMERAGVVRAKLAKARKGQARA
jgi:V/A-type H+-transporting ATPase subunit D